MQNPDRVRGLQARAEAVQAVVVTVPDFSAAVRYTVDLTVAQGGRTVVAPGLTAEQTDALSAACRAAGLTLVTPPLRAQAEGWHTALTVVDGGIAATGSLLLDSTAEAVRLATMLAETHVALLPAEHIRPDAQAWADELDATLKAGAPSYTAFITGASRTADIERVLAIGVHGPQALHILIREEPRA